MIDELLSLVKNDQVMDYYEKNFKTVCSKLSDRSEDGNVESMSVERVGCALIQSLCMDSNMGEINSKIYHFCFQWLKYYLMTSNHESLALRQNKLLKLRICHNLGLIFCKISDIDVTNQCIELFIQLLQGGNVLAQKCVNKFIEQNEQLRFLDKLRLLVVSQADSQMQLVRTSMDFVVGAG